MLALPGLVAAAPTLAAGQGAAPDWLRMGMALCGGLALFLFGMDQLSAALKAVAGERMRDILARLTGNSALAAVTGALITAVIQSSSVTTVLVVGFVSAGLMSLTQSVGVIMGANVGTTITAQIVAFKVGDAALMMIAVGFAAWFGGRRDSLRQYGAMVMGIGLVFYGMHVMSEGMSPLREHAPFIELMREMRHPLAGMLVGAVFTALVQSSSATTGIVIVLASQGFISLSAGIALALGANVGTCVTAMLASLGKPREAQRAAAVHVLFNLGGALLWLGLLDLLVTVATWLSPVHANLEGAARLAAETPRQIANANTAFNLINTLLFLPFCGQFARLVQRCLPDHAPAAGGRTARYLDAALVDTPTLALQRARMELGHLGELVCDMLRALGAAAHSRDAGALAVVATREQVFQQLRRETLAYLGSIGGTALAAHDSRELGRMLNATVYLEAIATEVATRLLPITRQGLALGPRPEPAVLDAYAGLLRTTLEAIGLAARAVSAPDPAAADAVRALKPPFRDEVASVLALQARDLGEPAGRRLENFRLEMEYVECVRRLYALCKRLADSIGAPRPDTAATP